jgi:hypothetical protein
VWCTCIKGWQWHNGVWLEGGEVKLHGHSRSYVLSIASEMILYRSTTPFQQAAGTHTAALWGGGGLMCDTIMSHGPSSFWS